MFSITAKKYLLCSPILFGTKKRSLATIASKKEGDISSVFVSLSGAKPEPLPPRFADLKRQLITGHEDKLQDSWNRLLRILAEETKEIGALGSAAVPEIQFKDIDRPSSQFESDHRKRGVAIFRNVVSEQQALDWKESIQAYVRQNPFTKAFPVNKPAVYELYWSQAQVAARAYPSLIKAQSFLMSLWHSKDEGKLIAPNHPVSYADRLRIRQPGDTGFALGPHVDGGSCERWEPKGYGRGNVYDTVFRGEWEKFDPFESSCRLPVVSDLYNGAGACSMFRMYQGWLSMSHTAPGEGTLLVNPLFARATAYYLLRPFFSPKAQLPDPAFLDASNWELNLEPTTTLEGAAMGQALELSETLHPHLDLQNTMVHVPTVHPGDYIAWHCDTIHAVDKVHGGKTDSSVLYIPACPLTETNAEYLLCQRAAFAQGKIRFATMRNTKIIGCY